MAKAKIIIDPKEAKTYLTVKEAIDLLSTHLDGKKVKVHSLENFMGAMMGCDIELTTIKKRLKACAIDEIRLSGPNARNQHHGVAILYKGSWLFLDTDMKKLEAIYKVRKLKLTY